MTALTQALMELRVQRDRYAAAVDALERLADDTSADRPVAAEPMAEAETDLRNYSIAPLELGRRIYQRSDETRRRMSLAQQKRHAGRKGRR